MTWCGEKWSVPAFVGLVAAWGGWYVSTCGGLLGGMGWTGSLWLSFVGCRVLLLVYPPLEVGKVYVLDMVEALGGVGRGASTLGAAGGR